MTVGATLLREMLDAIEGDDELRERVRRLLTERRALPITDEWVRVLDLGGWEGAARRAIKAGTLAAEKPGRELLVRRPDFEAWVASQGDARPEAEERTSCTVPPEDDYQRALRDGRLTLLPGGAKKRR